MNTKRFKIAGLVLLAITITAELSAQRATRNAKARSGYGSSGYGNSGYTTTPAGRDTTKREILQQHLKVDTEVLQAVDTVRAELVQVLRL